MFCQIIRSERGPLQKRGQDMQEMKRQTSFKVLFQISSHFVSKTSGYEKPVITIRAWYFVDFVLKSLIIIRSFPFKRAGHNLRNDA